MKELALNLLKFIPDYLSTIGRIVSSPHKFVREKTRGTEPPETYLPHALLTLAVSLLIALAFPGANKPPLFAWHSIILNAVYKLVEIILGAGILWLSWRVVGGRTSYMNFIVSYSYLLAAWLPIFAFLIAIDDGAMRLIDPKLSAEITALGSLGQDAYAMKVLRGTDEELINALRTPGFLWIMSMVALRGSFTFSWLIVSWGAFRKILRISWFRSAFSLAIFICLSLITTLLLLFFQMAPH